MSKSRLKGKTLNQYIKNLATQVEKDFKQSGHDLPQGMVGQIQDGLMFMLEPMLKRIEHFPKITDERIARAWDILSKNPQKHAMALQKITKKLQDKGFTDASDPVLHVANELEVWEAKE
jgi:hypothetical protein